MIAVAPNLESELVMKPDAIFGCLCFERLVFRIYQVLVITQDIILTVSTLLLPPPIVDITSSRHPLHPLHVTLSTTFFFFQSVHSCDVGMTGDTTAATTKAMAEALRENQSILAEVS